MTEDWRRRYEELLARKKAALEANPLYRKPGWLAAHARLSAILPGCRERIPAPYDMVPDAISDAASGTSLRVDWVLLPSQWERWSDLEIFDAVFGANPPTPGPLWFIPDVCFGAREPWLTQGEHLRELIAAEQCPLNADALFIWTESRRVSIIHHEGAYCHIIADPEEAQPRRR